MELRKRLALPLAAVFAVGLPAATVAQDGGGTLVAAIAAEPDQLDPHVTTSYNSFQVL